MAEYTQWKSRQQEWRLTPIHITKEERQSKQLSPANLQSGLIEFHQNGLVVLQNAIGLPAIDHIRDQMLQDIPNNLASPRAHYNHGKNHGNISQTPPLLKDFLHEDIYANHLAVAIMEHIIGPRPQLSFITSNIALPGGQGRQAVHSDYYCRHLDFPVFLEVYLYLDDVTPENGSTEVWLGTHYGYNKTDHSYSDMGWIKREAFDARAKVCPPFQPTIHKGSICIRDLRLWHAGMLNFTSTLRIMMGFIYSPRWFGSHMRLKFPAEARRVVESWKHIDIISVSEFVEGEFDYLEFRQDLILTQDKPDPNAPYVPKHGSTVAGPEDYWTPGEEKDKTLDIRDT
ncbi:hypothetical protein M426DRAFT_8985 [Hypoxylon sp. CI-4A]|nr:hypothetical protein M426DRAFT_8985 [Hypoxylon sp. CI-4A]